MCIPLHVSDHPFIRFSVRHLEHPTVPPPVALLRRNLRRLSSDEFSSLVASTLRTLSSFSSLEVSDAIENSLLHTELLSG